MSERSQRMYVESVSSSTVRLEPHPNDPESAGVGIHGITVTTTEATAEGGFWGVTGSCGVFQVIIRKLE